MTNNEASQMPKSVRIEADGVTVGYGKQPVIRDLSVQVRGGQFTVLIGPNGCGKSTLLKACARLIPLTDGHVRIDGVDVAATKPKELARTLAFLPQSAENPPTMTVFELVARGRFPHQSLFQQWSQDDADAVHAALRRTHLTDLADRRLDELSGGQRQRAWVAMVLAQEADIIFLDEPTTYLDLSHQVALLDLFRELQREGRTVVAVLHELSLAAAYADHLIVMKDGGIVREGTPAQVMQEDLLRDVFDLNCRVITDPDTQVPVVLPRSGAVPPASDVPLA